MKIGFWNRLAVVAGALFTFITPTWLVLWQQTENSRIRGEGYQTCLRAAYEQRGSGYLNEDRCWETWMNVRSGPGWTEWWQTVGAMLLLVGVIYLIVLAIVQTCKWVWRGRQAHGPSS